MVAHVILILGREDYEVKGSLGFVVGFCLKNKTIVADSTDIEASVVAQGPWFLNILCRGTFTGSLHP